MSAKKETTFCTHKKYNTVAPCDDSCFSTKKEKCNGTKAEWLLEFEKMVKDNSFVTPSSHLNVLAIQDFISQAITTAVAKRDLEIAEELRDLPGRTVSIGRVLQIIQS